MNVTPDKLVSAIDDVLDVYVTDLCEAINDETEAAAQKLKKDISADPPKRTGKQKKSWRVTTTTVAGFDLHAVVHSTDYRKVHLLENGHLTRSGTRTRAFHYVSSNEEKILAEYQNNVVKAIKAVK